MEKLKKNKGQIIISSIVILLPILLGILFWEKLPAEIATHFDSDGVPNGWSHKSFAVFGLPLFCLGCHLLCAFATCVDPKGAALNDKVYRLILWICPLVSWFCAVSIYANALGVNMNVAIIGEFFVGVVFIAVGNYLPKCRQNYTVGIKLPWTLNSEENWNRTHRMAGVLWLVCGVIMLIHSFVNFGGPWMLPAILCAAVILPTGYSFWYYLREKSGT